MNDAAIAEEVIDEVETTEAEAEEVETEEVTDEAAEGEDQPDEESSTSKKDDDEQEKRDRVQERIDEITRIRREEERQRIAAEQENERLRRELEQLKPKQPAGMTLADFDYDETKYSSYLTEQAAEHAKIQVQQHLAEEKQRQAQADFAVRESDYAMEHDDYHRLTRNPELKLTGEMVQVAQGSEHGPAILYHLAQNPDVSERISRMSPYDMAREIGRIEAKQETISKPASITSAPKPPSKLKATEAATTIRSDSPASDKLSTEEWVRRERKRLENRNK